MIVRWYCYKQRYYLDLAKSRGRIGSIASQQCLYQLSWWIRDVIVFSFSAFRKNNTLKWYTLIFQIPIGFNYPASCSSPSPFLPSPTLFLYILLFLSHPPTPPPIPSVFLFILAFTNSPPHYCSPTCRPSLSHLSRPRLAVTMLSALSVSGECSWDLEWVSTV